MIKQPNIGISLGGPLQISLPTPLLALHPAPRPVWGVPTGALLV